jgi:hypothetical protein
MNLPRSVTYNKHSSLFCFNKKACKKGFELLLGQLPFSLPLRARNLMLITLFGREVWFDSKGKRNLNQIRQSSKHDL